MLAEAAFGALDGKRRRERIGYERPPLGWRVPPHSFEARDLGDSSHRVDEASIRRDYGLIAAGALVARGASSREVQQRPDRMDVYRAYINLSDLDERLGEDDEESYPWEEFRIGRGLPAIKVAVGRAGEPIILDGNHRVRYWREAGYLVAPAWVIDARR